MQRLADKKISEGWLPKSKPGSAFHFGTVAAHRPPRRLRRQGKIIERCGRDI
jgi:hypothetical protein